MRKTILTLAIAMAFMLGATAQDRKISGRVVNEKAAPMEGVSVTPSGGQSGTQTDKNGNYSLSVSESARNLTFSYVNYESVTRTIGKQTEINVALNPSDTRLEEVVMVGYGIVAKKAFTGSASKIDAKEFATLVTPSIDKQLAGRAAGVNVNNSSGLVNAPARIRIRGTNSFSLDRSPLIVVDDVPITTGNLAQVGNSNAIGDINPDDIETIDVLKDGASTAIYGSAAANGVILITTKKGAKGRTSISYNGVVGYSSPMQKFDVLNAQQFVAIANEKFTNAGALPVARMDAAGTNTNWQDNVFVNNALSTAHTLSISGGNEKTSFLMSLNYAESRGIIRTNKNTAYRIRANVETQANKWLKISNNLAASRQNDFDQNNGTNALSGAIVGAIRALPNVSIFNPAHPTGYNIAPTANALGAGGNLRTIDDNYTNIAFVLDNNKYTSDKYRILNTTFVELSLVKGLKTHHQIGIDYFTDNSIQALDPRHGDGASSNGIFLQGQQNILRTDIQNYINYNLSARGHNFYLTAGHQLTQTTSRFYQAQGVNIADLFFIKENVISNAAITQSIFGNFVKEASESFFGRLNYDYKSRYFVQGTFRVDGQSSLIESNRYGNFPGVSVGWRPSQEKFWKSIPFLKNNISDLKLKASYAVVGNRLTGFQFVTLSGLRPYANQSGVALSQIGNPDLRWEQSKKYDIGMEIALLNNRINLAVDYFKNDIDDLILAVPVPFSAGVPLNAIPRNIGRVENKGLEVTFNATIVRSKDFEWNFNANYTHVKNKIGSLYNLAGSPVNEIFPTNYNIHRVGESMFSLYGYQYAGVNAGNGNPVYYNAAGQLVQRNIQTGTYHFANSMFDPALGAATTLTNSDKRILGSAQPTDFGAFTNTFAFKGFELEVMFRYQTGNKIMNITRQEVLLNQRFANSGTEILNRWTTPGQITDVPKTWYAQDAIINQNLEAISRFVEDGSFLRLQNIVMSYTVNSKKLQDVTNNAIKNARFFIQAQNIHVWTRYRGIDPEAYSEDGQDNNISPQVRNMSIGVTLGL